jgi:hypothetical protein
MTFENTFSDEEIEFQFFQTVSVGFNFKKLVHLHFWVLPQLLAILTCKLRILKIYLKSGLKISKNLTLTIKAFSFKNMPFQV